MAGEKVRVRSWGAMQYIIAKCKDFRGNMVHGRVLKEASGMIRSYFEWNIDGNSMENGLKGRDTAGKDSSRHSMRP